MDTLIDKLLDILVGIILMKIAYESQKNPQKLRLIRDSVIFLFNSLSMIPRAIFFNESSVQARLYGDQYPVEKETVGKWMGFYFWHIQRRVMVWFFPPALAWLVYTDPSMQQLNNAITYIILFVMGIGLWFLHNWARPEEYKTTR